MLTAALSNIDDAPPTIEDLPFEWICFARSKVPCAVLRGPGPHIFVPAAIVSTF